MAKRFGIIAEGITDLWTIANIIEGVFNDGEDEEQATSTDLQPMNSTDPGGYNQVFDYLQSDRFKQFFQEPNTFAIIHIDTDTKGHWSEHFSNRPELQELLAAIPLLSGGNHDAVPSTLEKIVQFFISLIGDEIWSIYSERIVFAIAVNEIECWILTLNARQNRKSDRDKMTGCLNALIGTYGFAIDPNAKAAHNGDYFKPSIKGFMDRREIERIQHMNASLDFFLSELYSIKSKK